MKTYPQSLVLLLCLWVQGGVVGAQSPGSGIVRVIVVGAPGGPSDSTMRLIVPALSATLGQPIVIENRPGTLGQQAALQVKSGPTDGRLLMLGNSGTHTVAPALYNRLKYDPITDFAPVTLINNTGFVLVSHPSFPARGFADFLGRARKQPGKIDIAIAGPTGDLAAESLMAATGMRLNNVRYKGSSPAEIAVLSGEVVVSILTPVATLSHIASGKLRALGVTTVARSPLIPAVPTMIELGVRNYTFHFWNGLFAPPGTPDTVIRNLHTLVTRAVAGAEVKNRYEALGFVTIAGKPEALGELIQGELARFRKLAADSGIGGRDL